MSLTDAHRDRLVDKCGIRRIDYWERNNALVSVDTEQAQAHLYK